MEKEIQSAWQPSFACAEPGRSGRALEPLYLDVAPVAEGH